MNNVALIKQKNYNKEEIVPKLKKILIDSGIIERIKDKNILIKPNVTGIFYKEEAKTTHPVVLDSLLNIIIPKCKSVSIGESSSYNIDTIKACKISGVLEIAEKYNINIIDFKKSKYYKVKVKDPFVLKEISLPKEIFEADYIISLAKLKTNYVSTISCSLKNLKGILRDSEKKHFHKIGVSEALIDLNSVLNNTIAIIDGIKGSELYEPKKGEILLASTNLLACDTIASVIMNIDPKNVKHLRLGELKKLGTIELKKIEIIGEDLTKIIKKFKYSPPNLSYLEKKFKITIINNNPCSNCIGSLYHCLKKAKSKDYKLEGINIIIGPKISNDTGIFFGNCACKNKSTKKVLGCAPASEEFLKILENNLV